jgi:hypothetical protein
MVTLKDATSGTILKSQAFDLGSPGTAPYATSTFTALGFAIPAGTSRALDVYVDVVAIDSNNAALSGQSVLVLLDGDEGFESTDGAGNLDTTLTGSTADLSSDGTNVGVAYVRKSVPTLSTDGTTSTSFAPISANAANVTIGRFTVAANSHGDVDWGKIVFNVTKSAAVTLDATTTIKVYDVTGGGHTEVPGTFATTTGPHTNQSQMFTVVATSGIIEFRPTAAQTVTMGSSKIYQVETTVGGLATTLSVSLSIATPSTSVTTSDFSTVAGTMGTALSTSVPSFAWSDWSDVSDHFSSAEGGSTGDWTNDFLVKSLPLSIGARAMP